MWDTKARIPFDPTLLTDRSDAVARDRLLAFIAGHPGVTVEELHATRHPGLFADLRAFHRDGLIRASSTPPRFFERGTRIFHVDAEVPAASPRRPRAGLCRILKRPTLQRR